MKLSIESYMIREKFGDFKALELIKEAGFDCVDFSYNNSTKDSLALGESYREYAKELKAHLDKLGLECNQAHAPFPMMYGYSFDESCPMYKDTLKAIESASILGAKSIIVHSIGVPPEEQEKGVDLIEYNTRFYKSFLPYCEKFGIRVAVENLFKRGKEKFTFMGRFAKPDELSDFVKSLGSPMFVACADVGHAALTGNLPEEFILGMNPEILTALHIQDGDYLDDRHTLPFLGEFPWDKVMKNLKAIGYNGELTFEIFKYFKNIPNDLIPYALKLAERTGRYLIKMFNEC